MHRNSCTARKNGLFTGLVILALVSASVLSGCAANNAAKTVDKDKAAATPKIKQEYVIINNNSGEGQSVAGKGASGKDKNQLEYERKRLEYNRQWASKQEAEKQALRDSYHRRFQQAQQQRLPSYASAQQVAAAQALPHYGTQPIIDDGSSAVRRQQTRQQNVSARGVPSRSGRTNVNLADHLSNAAIGRTFQRVRYDGRYFPISYPMGDVPSNIGVCTDTVIRSYRRLGIDLQRLVHEDMSQAFHVYPNLPKWGLSAPDPNIDHRRVHNLKVFFSRYGQRLPVTNNPLDYRPGDLVTWHLGGDQEHIGIVVNRRSPQDPRRHMIVHNIANGDRMEDILFTMPITGHFRYLPDRQSWLASR